MSTTYYDTVFDLGGQNVLIKLYFISLYFKFYVTPRSTLRSVTQFGTYGKERERCLVIHTSGSAMYFHFSKFRDVSIQGSDHLQSQLK